MRSWYSNACAHNRLTGSFFKSSAQNFQIETFNLTRRFPLRFPIAFESKSFAIQRFELHLFRGEHHRNLRGHGHYDICRRRDVDIDPLREKTISDGG